MPNATLVALNLSPSIRTALCRGTELVDDVGAALRLGIVMARDVAEASGCARRKGNARDQRWLSGLTSFFLASAPLGLDGMVDMSQA